MYVFLKFKIFVNQHAQIPKFAVVIVPPHECNKCLDTEFVCAGFCIELIERLGELLQFNYTFEVQPDNKYGSFNQTSKKWDGMIRRIMDEPVLHTFELLSNY